MKKKLHTLTEGTLHDIFTRMEELRKQPQPPLYLPIHPESELACLLREEATLQGKTLPDNLIFELTPD